MIFYSLMTERTLLGYCVDCPMTEWLNMHAETYIADASSTGMDESSVEILTTLTDLSEEDIIDAASAFSMSDRDAIRFGVSKAEMDEMKKELSESYSMLGKCALDSDCKGKLVAEGEQDKCAAVGGKSVYVRMMKAFEINILGFES
jgi:hypothetical protein